MNRCSRVSRTLSMSWRRKSHSASRRTNSPSRGSLKLTRQSKRLAKESSTEFHPCRRKVTTSKLHRREIAVDQRIEPREDDERTRRANPSRIGERRSHTVTPSGCPHMVDRYTVGTKPCESCHVRIRGKRMVADSSLTCPARWSAESAAQVLVTRK